MNISQSPTELDFHGVQLLGRTINLRNLISERINKVCRENIEFLFDRFESQDICAVVVSDLVANLSLFYLSFPVLSEHFDFSGIRKAP